VEAGTQEKLDPLRDGGGLFFEVTELELGRAGKVGINAGIGINRHADPSLFKIL
jgi:hypothetical protein